MSDNTVEGLKQRLVGAFVILSLAVIFLPMIFDKPHSVGSSEIVEVPPEPAIPPVIIKRPEKPTFTQVDVDPSDQRVKTVDKIAALLPKDQSPTTKAAAKNVPSASGNKRTTPAVVSVSSETVSAEKSVDTASSETLTKIGSPKKAAVIPAKTSDSPMVSHLSVFKNVWMVQLGTFSNHQNAYTLRDRLRKDGFDGHTKTIVIDGKKAMRVFTGPFVNKSVAQKMKKKVDGKYRVDSLVLYFDA